MERIADPSVLAVAVLVATGGLYWFHAILKTPMRRLPMITRAGFYVLIWLAYFVLTAILATNMNP